MPTVQPTAQPAQTFSSTYESLPASLRENFCPPVTYTAQRRLSWIQRFLQTAERTRENSPNYQRLKIAVDALQNYTQEKTPEGRRTQTEFNLTKRQAKKIVATLSDISPSWKYDTPNRKMDDSANLLSRLFSFLWDHPNTSTGESLIELFQYAITGEGYLSPIWEDDIYSQLAGSVGLKFRPYSIDSIYHTQLPKDKNLQKCYTVAICDELPITMACTLYPKDAQFLHPSARPVGFFRRLGQKLSNSLFGSPALQAAEMDREKYYGAGGGSGQFDTQMDSLNSENSVEIFDLYILDCSVNQSRERLKMGTPGTSNYYEVPYVGEPLSTGVNSPNGQPLTRPATPSDCLIYPYRRRIICTRDHIIYDGSSPWLHGQVPLVRFAPDDWPWDDVADSLALGPNSLNKMIESIFRGVEDMVQLRLNPPMKLPNTLSKDTTDSIDLRKPGRHLRVDAFESTKVDTLHPPLMLQVEPQIIEFLSLAKSESDYIIGEADMRSLAQAAQIPSAESVDRFLQAVSPLATMISRSIERSLMKVGNLTLYLLAQFADAPFRMRVFGDDGIVKEDLDLDPGNLIPAGPGLKSDRIREFSKQFFFSITPGSAYRITDQTRQLMIFQLWRDMRFPIGPWTLAKAFNFDIGSPPPEAKTEFDQWLYYQEITSKFQASLQAQAQLIMAQAQIEAQRMAMAAQGQDMMAGMGALMSGEEGQESGGSSQGESSGRRPGRPPSGNAPPKLERKSDGRTTIAES